jgi:hypothetical protein
VGAAGTDFGTRRIADQPGVIEQSLTSETAEIIAWLPLLPVLDHHQVAGAFTELRKQKPLAALETIPISNC